MTLMSDKPVTFLKPYATKGDKDDTAEVEDRLARVFGPQEEPDSALERLLDRIFGKKGAD